MGVRGGYLALALLPLVSLVQAQETCQGNYTDGSVFTDTNGQVYQVHCSYDVQTGTDATETPGTFENCAEQCDAYTAQNPSTPCVVSVEDKTANVCNIKTALNYGVNSTVYDTIFLLSNATTCGYLSNGTSLTANDGAEYQVACQTDVQLPDISTTDSETFEDCINDCEAWSAGNPNEPCELAIIASAQEGGNPGCHLKGSNTYALFTGQPLYNALVKLQPPNQCYGVDDGSIITAGGVQYSVHCNTDIQVDDEDSTSVSSTDGDINCGEYCSQDSQCQGVVIEDQGSTFICHKKTEVSNVGFGFYGSLFRISNGTYSNTTSSAPTSTPTSAPVSSGTSLVVSSGTSLSFPFPNNTLSLSTIGPMSIPTLTGTSVKLPSTTPSLSVSVPTSLSVPTSISIPAVTTPSGTAVLSSTGGSGVPTSGGSGVPTTSGGFSTGIFTNSSATTFETATATSISTAPSATSTSGPSPFFLIEITISAGLKLYVSANGTLVDISLAVEFQIVEEELYQVTGGQRLARRALGRNIATSPGAQDQLFAPPTFPIGNDVATEFIFPGFGNGIIWDNSAFYGGAATYCIIDTELYAIFVESYELCQSAADPIVVPVTGASSTTSGVASATSGIVAPTGTGSTVINNYNSVTTYNNVNYNININIDISLFKGCNYLPCDAQSFYAILCPVCPPVKVYYSDLTYATAPCPVCPPTVYKLGSCSGPVNPSGPANYTYGSGSCVTCQAPPPSQPLAVVPAPCPTCPGSTSNIVCPASATSSIASVASKSGAAAAAKSAKSAITLTVTQTVAGTAGAAPVAPSSVANVPCPSCPAGAAPVTLPQVAATAAGGAPAVKPAPSSGLSPPIQAFKGAAPATAAPLAMGLFFIGSLAMLIAYL